MVDDSPGNETTSTFHRKGTFTDIDANGTQVNKIVGDGYIIMDRNGSIYIAGAAQVTFGGYTNIMCLGNADIEVNGKTTLNVNNDLSVGVASDMTLAVGGDLSIKAGGNINMEAGDSQNLAATNNFNIGSGKDYNIGIGGKYQAKVTSDYDISCVAGINIIAGKDIAARTNAALFITSKKTQNFLAGGKVFIDGERFESQGGLAGEAKINPVKLTPITVLPLTPPPAQIAAGGIVPALETPERDWSGVASFESPEELHTPEGMAESKASAAKTPPGVKEDPTYNGNNNASSSPVASGVAVVPQIIILSDIKGRTDFPASYKISKNFNVGNMTGGKPILIQKNLPGNAFGKARILTVAQTVENFAYLAENVLEVVYMAYGPTGGASMGGAQSSSKGVWQINDGLRIATTSSEHCEGCAVDIRPINRGSQEVYDMAKTILPLMKFNNFCLEYRTPTSQRPGETKPLGSWWRWIHISHRSTGNTSFYATMLNDKTPAENRYKLIQIDEAKL
jgi:hypothetical protein